MRIPKIMSRITFKQNELNVEYEKQKAEAEKRQKEAELKLQAEWKALVNKPQKFQVKGDEKDGK